MEEHTSPIDERKIFSPPPESEPQNNSRGNSKISIKGTVFVSIIVLFGLLLYWRGNILDIIGNFNTPITWSTQPKKVFDISQYPIFKSYGYSDPEDTHIEAVANTSSTTFAALSKGIILTSLKGNTLVDLRKNYPVSSVLVFNKDAQILKIFPFSKPVNPCCGQPAITWLGNQYILAYQYLPPHGDPRATSSPEYGHYFYVADTASASTTVFEKIPFTGKLSMTGNADVAYYPNPSKALTIVSYCKEEPSTPTASCRQRGFAVGTPQRVEEVLVLEVNENTDYFKIGWHKDQARIDQLNDQNGTSTSHSIPLASYENDQFISELAQHIDPSSKGTPAFEELRDGFPNKINAVEFELDFDATTTYGRALFSMTIDNKVVALAYEEQDVKGAHRKSFYFPEIQPGTHTFATKVEPLNKNIRSGIWLKNVKFGYVDLPGNTPLSTSTLPSNQVQTYTHKNKIFTVKYPKGWKAYETKAFDTAIGGVNIYPPSAVPTYQKADKLSFSWTDGVLPFDQYNTLFPIISIGGEVSEYDAYTHRGQYIFRDTPIYKAIKAYFSKGQTQGLYQNVVLTDTMIGAEPALVATYENLIAATKSFYMIKLATGSITEKLPVTAYYMVQYTAPKKDYSDEIANTLKTSFKDDVGAAMDSKPETSPTANKSTPSSQGHVWKTFVPGPFSQEVNMIDFDYKFTDPPGSEGLLTIYWDDTVLFSFDGRAIKDDHASFLAPVGKVYKSNPFTIGFRLDYFTKIPSSVEISNIEFSYLDPTKPRLQSVTKISRLSATSTPSIQSQASESTGTILFK